MFTTPRKALAALALAFLVATSMTAMAQEKKAEPKQEEPKKAEPIQDPASKLPTWQKYKDAEEAFNKARQAAAKEMEDAIVKADAASNKAQKELSEVKDPMARIKAKEAIQQLSKEAQQLRTARSHLDSLYHLGPAIPKPIPEETRLQVRLEKPSDTLAAQLNLEPGHGTVITYLEKDGIGERAGLQKFDVLVQINGKPVLTDVNGFRKVLSEIKSDTPVTATIFRKGKQEMTKEFKLPAYGTPATKAVSK